MHASDDSRAVVRYDAVMCCGRFVQYCLPATVYHGTSAGCLATVLDEGLRPDIRDKQSALSRDLVYFATDAAMAAHLARTRASRRGETAILLAINAACLHPDQLGFDLNMPGSGWSESVTYGGVVPPDAITVLPTAAAQVAAGLMILGDPLPGNKPLAFDLKWSRAHEFLEYVNLQDTRPKALRAA